ncbi:hypothetical protein GI374_14415 [Paracoccus sp. S-4012]|nr:hypothetical protein [Paracoccus sp. S-4012]MRX51609.1 hypothetical protein [Paracoccus sp. S-4012]
MVERLRGGQFALSPDRTEAHPVRHEEMGFAAGWGTTIEQLAELVE